MSSIALRKVPMNVDGEYLFDAPPSQVWDVLFDPNVLASVLPGALAVQRDGDRYTSELTLHLGPIEGTFQGAAVARWSSTAGATRRASSRGRPG
jgi:uncharacterized protein